MQHCRTIKQYLLSAPGDVTSKDTMGYHYWQSYKFRIMTVISGAGVKLCRMVVVVGSCMELCTMVVVVGNRMKLGAVILMVINCIMACSMVVVVVAIV